MEDRKLYGILWYIHQHRIGVAYTFELKTLDAFAFYIWYL